MSNKIEPNKEKSEDLARVISTVNVVLISNEFDHEYGKVMANELKNQATRQESIAILNPSHPQIKNDILRLQGKALEHLSKYVETLQEIEKLKEKLKGEEEIRSRIDKLFM